MHAGRDSVARITSRDTTKQDTRLVVIERTVGIAGRAKNFQRVDGLIQVFSRMAGTSVDVNIKGHIGRAPRNHDTSLESIVKDQSFARAPGSGVERAGPMQTD